MSLRQIDCRRNILRQEAIVVRNTFASIITALAKEEERIIVLMGDTGAGLFDELIHDRPDQFINAGIAEANMVTVAAGLSKAGFIPFVYAIGPHLVLRAYEQIRNDVCLNQSNVKLVSVGSGLHYADHGPTHHNLEDLSVLRPLPNLTIFSPAGPSDTATLTAECTSITGPVYLRLGRGKDIEPHLTKSVVTSPDEISFEIDVAIFATGGMVSTLASIIPQLNDVGIPSILINVTRIKPLDRSVITEIAHKANVIFTAEEHQQVGGLGDAVASILATSGLNRRLIKFGIDDTFCAYVGTYSGMQLKYGLSSGAIFDSIRKEITGHL